MPAGIEAEGFRRISKEETDPERGDIASSGVNTRDTFTEGEENWNYEVFV